MCIQLSHGTTILVHIFSFSLKQNVWTLRDDGVVLLNGGWGRTDLLVRVISTNDVLAHDAANILNKSVGIGNLDTISRAVAQEIDDNVV